jgi:hypothetical protein
MFYISNSKKMKRTTLYIVIAAGMTLSSCEKFLTEDPYSSMPEELAITDNTTANYALVGIYDRFQSTYFYGRHFLAAADACTPDVQSSPVNSGRYLGEMEWTMTNANADAADIWNYGYSAINAANKILSKVDGIDATEKQRQQIKGEALAIRGMVHLYLVRFFAQEYGNANDLGIPYMSESIIYDRPSRNSIGEVYTKVIADLEEASSLLKESGIDRAPYRINVWAAKALLAKAHMMKLDYAAAKPILKDIIDNSKWKLLSNGDYQAAWSKKYNAAANTEFIFAISNLATDYAATGSLGYIYVQAGYGDLRANTSIVRLYGAGDVRGKAFFTAGTGTQTSYTFVNKYPFREGSNGLSDIPMVRLSDVYLYYAEACSQTSEQSIAIEYLDKIRKRADPSAAASTESGTDLLEKILLERRKELAYEGEYLFDLKRYKKVIAAPNASATNRNVVDGGIPYPSERRAFPIPQAELDANPNIAPNPGY